MDNKEELPEGTFKIDDLWYDGEGDLLDTEEGRAKFCKLNESSIYKKEDPNTYNDYIWVFNVQNVSMTIKKRSQVDSSLYECKEYNAEGKEINKFFDPYE